MPRHTEEEVQALADAMWQLLDDMGRRDVCVCLAAKAQAVIAYEPFRETDTGPVMPIAEAQRIVAEADY